MLALVWTGGSDGEPGFCRKAGPILTPAGAMLAVAEAMLTLVERNSGKSKSFVVENVKAAILLPILRENIAKEAVIYTDTDRCKEDH